MFGFEKSIRVYFTDSFLKLLGLSLNNIICSFDILLFITIFKAFQSKTYNPYFKRYYYAINQVDNKK